MIAVTFALPTESLDLRRRLREPKQTGYFVSGRINEREITILHTGVGAKNCNDRIEALLHKVRPRIVISTGFAGALVADLEVGDLVIAENFSDQRLIEAAKRALPNGKFRTAKIFTSASIIDSIAERNQIAAASGAAAVEMETGAIASVCHSHGVPLLALRAISDTPEQPFPVPPSVLFDLGRQRTDYARLLGYLLAHPAAIPRLVAFGRKINRVRAQLTDAIVAVIGAL
ncbi:MAG TPA: hypothetical protein VJ721_02955 [Chthoniobacterales bacterium]|nr:hypothetical protein [Chthoniobacterales bacterium]